MRSKGKLSSRGVQGPALAPITRRLRTAPWTYGRHKTSMGQHWERSTICNSTGPQFYEAVVKRFLTIAFALCAASAMAAEHLVPEDNEFTRADLSEGAISLAPYYTTVVTVLEDAFAPDVRARVIAMPSFTPEYAVGIKVNGDRYTIFHIGLDTQLWHYETLKSLEEVNPALLGDSAAKSLNDTLAELRDNLPADFRDVGTKACEFEIAPAIGGTIMAIWNTMLLQTRYAETGNFGRDGTDYHFSMVGGGQLLAGKVWEPPPDSKTGRLVSIAETMKNLCLTGDTNLIGQLQPQLDALSAQLTE